MRDRSRGMPSGCLGSYLKGKDDRLFAILTLAENFYTVLAQCVYILLV